MWEALDELGLSMTKSWLVGEKRRLHEEEGFTEREADGAMKSAYRSVGLLALKAWDKGELELLPSWAVPSWAPTSENEGLRRKGL